MQQVKEIHFSYYLRSVPNLPPLLARKGTPSRSPLLVDFRYFILLYFSCRPTI